MPVLSPVITQFIIRNREFASLFQDNNADGTSRKGDEEEGAANVRKIPIAKRFFEFYDAPFTKFWFNTVSLHSLKIFKQFFSAIV